MKSNDPGVIPTPVVRVVFPSVNAPTGTSRSTARSSHRSTVSKMLSGSLVECVVRSEHPADRVQADPDRVHDVVLLALRYVDRVHDRALPWQ